MILRRILIGLCGALLVVGLSFGEASAVRLEFSGTGLTGFFEYTAPGSGVTYTPPGGLGAYTSYSGITGSYQIDFGGVHLTGTILDARVFNDYSTTSTGAYDTFRIATNATPDFSGYPRFQMDFTNKIGTASKQADLVGGLGLPESLNLFELRGYDATTPLEEYTEIIARYWVSASSSDSTAFAITNVTFTSAAPDPQPAPVPEPATMFLLGSGLIGIGVFVRRKFRK
jgi:hypothetical protein